MIAYVFQKYPENFTFQLFIILQLIYLQSLLFSLKLVYFLTASVVFSIYKQTLILKTRAAMNPKMSVFDFCVEKFIYLLLYNL